LPTDIWYFWLIVIAWIPGIYWVSRLISFYKIIDMQFEHFGSFYGIVIRSSCIPCQFVHVIWERLITSRFAWRHQPFVFLLKQLTAKTSNKVLTQKYVPIVTFEWHCSNWWANILSILGVKF
jgi:hypothetical protein